MTESQLAVLASSPVTLQTLDRVDLRPAKQDNGYWTLFSSLREPVITADEDGIILEFNGAAADLFGAGCLTDQHISAVLPFAATTTDGPSRWQGAIKDVVGRDIDLDVSLTILPADSVIGRFVYLIHDVCHHTEASRVREQFLYAIAHELGSPLSVLDSALELLEEEYGSLTMEDFNKILGSARRTSDRVRRLLDDLMNAGSLRAGRFRVTAEPLPLGQIVRDALDSARLQASMRNQAIYVHLDDDEIMAMCDKRYTGQVVTNLISNASKYSPEGAAIHVYVGRKDDMARVEVRDAGAGIPMEQRKAIFERYYRLQNEPHSRGIGLGLAISKGIVVGLGGDMNLESEMGVGTTVWFSLPLA